LPVTPAKKVASYSEKVNKVFTPGIEKTRHIKRKRKIRYKSQERLTRILESLFNMRAETEKTFPWLRSPRGAALRIDIYFPQLSLAVEYNGKQHAEFPNYFHKTAKDFRYAAMCDAWKYKALTDRGIRLIVFTYKDKINRSGVVRKLKKLGVISNQNTFVYGLRSGK